MKRLYDWFTNMYDEYDDEKGEWKGIRELLLQEPDPRKGKGVRIVVRCKDDDDKMTYIQDLFEGKDFGPDDDMFEVITKAIEDIMENMP